MRERLISAPDARGIVSNERRRAAFLATSASAHAHARYAVAGVARYSREYRLQRPTRMAGRDTHQAFGIRRRDDRATAHATLRSDIDDPVRLGDHIEIV